MANETADRDSRGERETRLDPKMLAVAVGAAIGLLALVVLGFLFLARYGLLWFIVLQAVAAMLVAFLTQVVLPRVLRRTRR